MRKSSRFRRLFGLDPQGDVDDELSFHLEMRVRELVELGTAPERARELALRRFGDYETSRRECVVINQRRGRRMGRAEFITQLKQDVGYSLRMLRRTPAFTAVAILTLALGIGANSAIFSVVHGVLLQSLPFRDAERLYRVRMLYPDGTIYSALSAPDFMSVRQDSRVFEQVEAYSTGVLTLVGVGEPREIRGRRVSDGMFSMLGLNLTLGRGFLPEEHQPGRGAVAVLDYAFWQRELGGDGGVLGRRISLGGRPYTIVGVLAAGVRLPASEADIYAPLEYGETFSAATATDRRNEYLGVIGRAKPAIDGDAVDADVRRVGEQLQKAFPQSNESLAMNTKSLRETIVGDVRAPLLVLLGAVGFVLLVACANVANLLLARASSRQSELAVRAALGAGRGRLLRQLLTEGLVLSLAGGAVGLAIAYWGTRALVAAQPADIPRLDEVGVSGRVVLFTLAVSLLTSLVFGILPAWHTTRGGLTRALREGGRGSGGGGQTARTVLVVAEMSLAVVLLIGAGLLIRSFVALTRVQPGFDSVNAMTFRVPLQGETYRAAQEVRNRVTALEERIRALPGVTAVGVTSNLPLTGLNSIINFRVDDAPPPPPNVNEEIAIASVTPEYFRAIGTPLRRGRLFAESDRADGPLVALINEAAARKWFPGRDPLGKRVTAGSGSREVVGIVGDALQENPGEPAAAQLFTPYAQVTGRTLRVVVRSAGDPLPLAPAIRAEIRALDPNLAIGEFTALEELVTTSVARPRFYTSVLTLSAAVALALAATGIFGVMSYTVAQRTREISIRMALGAYVGDVLRMIVGRAMLLAAAGAAIGIVGAVLLGRVIQNQLFGVALIDPVTLAGVVIVLMACAAAASFLPARRAAALDPACALRE